MSFEHPHTAIDHNLQVQRRSVEGAFESEGIDSDVRDNLKIATAGIEEQVLAALSLKK